MNDFERNCFLFTIWFHDVVYEPKAPSSQNEDLSVALWKQFAEEFQLDLPLIETVCQMIDDTKKHEVCSCYDGIEGIVSRDRYRELSSLFLDCDLSILGASPSDYDQYAR